MAIKLDPETMERMRIGIRKAMKQAGKQMAARMMTVNAPPPWPYADQAPPEFGTTMRTVRALPDTAAAFPSPHRRKAKSRKGRKMATGTIKRTVENLEISMDLSGYPVQFKILNQSSGRHFEVFGIEAAEGIHYALGKLLQEHGRRVVNKVVTVEI